MLENVAARYQAVKVTTSSPGELLIALLEGLFKFLNVGRLALRNKARPQASEAMSRAHAILSELLSSLDPQHAPELCQNLEAIYGFCLDRITEANLHSNPEALDEVIHVMLPIREGFTTAVRSVAVSSVATTGTRGR